MSRILLVDDEATIRETFEFFLSSEGHEVVLAADYSQATVAMENAEFDLIIADIVLGEQTGIDLLETVKKCCPDTPMVMITGQPAFDSAAQAVRLGAFDYLFKPIRRQELVLAANKALQFRNLTESQRRLDEENDNYRHKLEELTGRRTQQLLQSNEKLRAEIRNRTQIESALAQSEKRYRDLVETAPHGVIETDNQGRVVFCNSRLASLFGFSPRQAAGMEMWGLFAGQEKEAHYREMFTKLFAGSHMDNPSYMQITSPRGERLEYQVDWRLRRSEGGEAVGLIAVLTDITCLRQASADLEKRVAERTAELRRSTDTVKALLEVTNDSVLLMDLEGNISEANAAIATRLGQSQQRVLEANLFDVLPDQTAAIYKDKIRMALHNAAPERFIDHEEGSAYEQVVYPILDSDNTPYRVALFGHDITAITVAERQIKGLTRQLIKAQEYERQRIALDLHDHVAQDLSSLKIACETMLDNEPQPQFPRIRERLDLFSKALLQIIADVRHIAYELRPPGLDKLGLVRTIARYCEDFSVNTGVAVDFFSAGVDDLKLDYEVEINLYRIVQEALANIRKHAGAKKAIVRLVASHPTLILRVEDNGCGFEANDMAAQSHSIGMGLQGIEQRAGLLDGSLQVRSAPGQGAKLAVEIPLQRRPK